MLTAIAEAVHDFPTPGVPVMRMLGRFLWSCIADMLFVKI